MAIRSKNPQPAKTTTRTAYEEIDLKEARSICFFNNKGGVGKTTLVANLAAQLALFEGFRVLVVDADPQCNLTQYVLSDDDFTDIYDNDPIEKTLYSVIHPLSIGKGYSETLPLRAAPNFGFDIIIGDPRLALKEDLLAQDWRDAKAGGTRGLRTTLVFSDLISKAKKEYDFIFFDMGPSLGAINRAILLAADYFLVPMSIDIFSIWAIKNIGEALKVWERDISHGISMAEDPSEIAIKNRKGKRIGFLGYVTQQHKEKSENGSPRIVAAYQNIREKMPNEVSNTLNPFFGGSSFDPSIGTIKHLGSLAPKSQTVHAPMINVTAKGSFTSTRKQAREIYTNIAEKFIDNLKSHEKKQ